MKASILLATLLSFGSAAALADDNDDGLYLGAGVGQFNLEIDSIEGLPANGVAFDDENTSWKLFTGWRFFSFLAIELTYVDLGKAEDTVGALPVETDIAGFAPYVMGTLPLGPLELFARVGYYFYDIQINQQNLDILDDSDEDLTYGAGIGLTLFDHLHARVEYEVIDISEVDDANALWVSAAWRF